MEIVSLPSHKPTLQFQNTYIKNRYFSINRPKKVWIEDLYNVNCIFYPIDKDNQELESASQFDHLLMSNT